MNEVLRLYANRITRLRLLLREYEQFLVKWDGAELTFPDRRTEDNSNIIESYVQIKFYKNVVSEDTNKNIRIYETNNIREFNLTIDELDKAIDRWRQKISHEKKKETDGEQD